VEYRTFLTDRNSKTNPANVVAPDSQLCGARHPACSDPVNVSLRCKLLKIAVGSRRLHYTGVVALSI